MVIDYWCEKIAMISFRLLHCPIWSLGFICIHLFYNIKSYLAGISENENNNMIRNHLNYKSRHLEHKYETRSHA